MAGQAEDRLRNLALTAKKIYIFELYAKIAMISELRGGLSCRKTILFVDDESASAALTEG